MPNTFLNTSRSIAATSNPVANVQQVTDNNQQAVSSNVNGTNGIQTPQVQSSNNSINPITIPIQIQPQIAQKGEPETTSANIQQGIQTISNQPQTNMQQNQAPIPQQYQDNTQNSNVVDFNQIYSNYQNNFGNNQQLGISGIKKSSIGTTIVTPTAYNLNSIQGQYQSAYADTVNSLIAEMLKQMSEGFQYDPNSDEALKVATEYSANSTLQSLAGSGVLNSSATAERVARIVSELIPQYEEKAHNRWIEYLGQLSNTAQVVMNYDSQQFEYWKDAKNREFENKQFEYQKQQDALENAWKRVDELGYVDNYASTILGVKVGTLSREARQAKEEREFQLQKMREQLEIERANEEALYKLKSELDLERSKQLASYQSQLSREEAKYEYDLQRTYETSSNNTSLSTYKDIINNRYANYDDITKKYTLSNNNELYNYLISENAKGRLSDSDMYTLLSFYGVQSPDETELKDAVNRSIADIVKNAGKAALHNN